MRVPLGALKKGICHPRLVRGCTVGKERGFACRLKRMSDHPNRVNRPAVSTKQRAEVAKVSAAARARLAEPSMAGVRLLLAVLASSACALQPVLRFRDPKTRGEVVLVGCMHYNPVSIALASSVVREEV